MIFRKILLPNCEHLLDADAQVDQLDPKDPLPYLLQEKKTCPWQLFIHKALNEKSETQDSQEHGAGGGGDCGDGEWG